MEELRLDTSWVKPFIHDLFSRDSKDADIIMASKMIHMNKPFYKYCYVCEDSKRTPDTIDYNILNFENDQLFFQDPSLFNDPFDCYLGFSQTELIKNILIASMKQQKKLTPQMRKAINQFFKENDQEELPVEKVETSILIEAIKAIMPTLLESMVVDEKEQAYIKEMVDLLATEEHIELFVKLIQNKLTIADKQKIIDLLYDNKTFCEYTKSSLENPDHSEWILRMARRDMKLKIETHPDSFMSDGGSETFQFVDFLQALINSSSGTAELPELAEIKEQIRTASNEAMEKSRNLISKQCRVTCLSERMDSPLMWSHYANKHYGFCLEYDFTHTMVKRYPDLNLAKIMLLPVIYSEQRPLLTKAITNPKILVQYMKTKKLPNEIIESIVYGMLFKSIDWAYEQEWRIIGLNMETPFMKLPPARKLFLGANIEDSAKERLIAIAKKKRIPIFQMYLAPDKYKFEYHKVE